MKEQKKETKKFEALLTAEEILDIDTIHKDTTSNDAMLNIALNFYSNRNNELLEKRKAFWENLAEKHKLDLVKNEYVVDSKGPNVKIIEVGPK